MGQKEGGYTICRADCVAPFGIVREEPRGSCPRLVEGFDDRKELLYAKGSTTNQTAIYVRLSEEFFGVASVAAPTIEDRTVVSDCFAILLGDELADMGMDFLSLSRGSRKTGTDGPHRFVGEDYLAEVFG